MGVGRQDRELAGLAADAPTIIQAGIGPDMHPHIQQPEFAEHTGRQGG